MKTASIERYEEHLVLLEEGVDYEKSALELDGLTGCGHGLSSKKLTEIAIRKGFHKWTWTGKTYGEPFIKAKFAKSLFL